MPLKEQQHALAKIIAEDAAYTLFLTDFNEFARLAKLSDHDRLVLAAIDRDGFALYRRRLQARKDHAGFKPFEALIQALPAVAQRALHRFRLT